MNECYGCRSTNKILDEAHLEIGILIWIIEPFFLTILCRGEYTTIRILRLGLPMPAKNSPSLSSDSIVRKYELRLTDQYPIKDHA